MKREKLKQLLLKHYSVAGANMILRGERKPSYEVMFQLSENVPFTAWKDIKSFISNDIKSTKNTQVQNKQKV